MNSFDGAFHKHVYERVLEKIAESGKKLALGSALGSDVSATALAYSEAVGYNKGLRAVLQICDEVADHLTGRGKK